jgi:phosphonate transport system substrate-binding protein
MIKMPSLQKMKTVCQRSVAGYWIGAAIFAMSPAMAETLYFAPLPMEQPEEVVKQFKPMLNYLERQLGVTIEIRYSSSYEDVLAKFQQGQVDFAYLGPLPYVTLRERFNQAVPLVHFVEKSGKPTYTCALISAGETVTNGMKGKKIALTQALSTCGYLSTDGLLHKAGSGLDQNKYRYLGKHDAVAEAVARGDYEFGGIKTAIANKYEGLGVKVLAETAPLPSFALIANGQRLSPARIDALRDSLARLKPETTDKTLMADWGSSLRFGSTVAKDSDFDVVRQLRRRADIPEKGNF